MQKISTVEKNIDLYLNDDNLYGWFYVDTDLTEMARLGVIPKTKYEIHIEGGEGCVPHMHICKKTGKNVILRLRLDRNEYFREKDDIKNTLNSSERKALNTYLSKTVPYSNNTEWVRIVHNWNEFNSSHMIDLNKVHQPDYTTIEEPK